MRLAIVITKVQLVSPNQLRGIMKGNSEKGLPLAATTPSETLLSASMIVGIGVLALICGYAVLATLSTLVQETWLHGVSYKRSTLSVLLLAGILTPLCGIPSGFVAGLIGRRAPLAHGMALCAIVATETVFLIATHRVDGPLWFEASAGASVGAGVVLGAWITHHWIKKRQEGRAG